MTKVKYGKYKYLTLFFIPFLAVALNSHSSFATCSTDANTGVVTCSESASASVTVAEACTLTATTSPAHTATLANGIYSGGVTEYANGIGNTRLKVVCNDASGFSIYAVGYTNNEYGNTKLMSNEQDATAPIINTGTQDSGSTSAWSMKLTSVTGTYAPTLDNSFGSYHSVPSTYTRVAYRTSGTDAGSNPTGSSVDTTYAAFISPTQPAGTYVGKVKYTLVHPYTDTPPTPQVTQAGKICYYPNGSNVEGTMGCQTISANDTSATLLASNFSRDGYGFAGWSTTFDYSNLNGFLGPQEEITFAAGTYTGSNPGLSLYAHWVKSEGNLQNWTCPNNTTMPIGTVKALTDQRDNDTYAIAKLADGNCWMIENLRLESTAAHNSDGTLAQGYGTSATYGNFSGLADPESTGFTSTYSANSLYSNDGSNDTINIGTSSIPAYRMPRYNNWNHQVSSTNRPQNPTTNSAANSTTIAGMYSYGNYYTWHAAIADLTYNGTNNSSVTNTSLCPKGWRLPKSGDKTRITSNNDNEFWNLVVVGLNGGTLPANYDSQTRPYYTGAAEAGPVSNALRAYPNNFLYSGRFNTASAYNRGSFGVYWSSTALDSNYSYYLYLSSTDVYPGTVYNSKYYGYSIRCLASGA